MAVWASVILPRHTARSFGRHTKGPKRKARWQRRFGYFPPARCAPKRKSNQRKGNFRTRSAPIGRAATLAVPLRLFPPWRTARPNGSRTNERETAARAAPLSDAPPRWRRGLGSFTPALCAPKQKTHEWARHFRTRSAALGRAATLAVPLRLFFPVTLRAQTEVEPTRGELPHAQRRFRARRHVGSAAPVISPQHTARSFGGRANERDNFHTHSVAFGRAATLAVWASVISPRRTARSYRRHTNEREASARAAPLPGAPPRAQDRFGYLSPAHCAPKRKSNQ